MLDGHTPKQKSHPALVPNKESSITALGGHHSIIEASSTNCHQASSRTQSRGNAVKAMAPLAPRSRTLSLNSYMFPLEPT